MSRVFRITVLLTGLLAITLSAPAQEGHGAAAPPAPAAKPLLPTDFAGWHTETTPKPQTDPQAADATNASLLQEDGFHTFVHAVYTRNGDTLKVRAIQFADASGAYAAYTFYRRPGLPKQDVGDGGVFDGSRVLFWQGAVVVDATFDHITAMSASELRQLAATLPQVSGPAGVPAPLPGYLPQANLDPQTTRYALGPIGYVRAGGVLPPNLVDFNRGAETITAQYSGRNGDATLTILSYPTPQLAADRERAISAFLKAGNTQQAPWPSALAGSAPAALQARRSGTLVAVTSGAITADYARKLLNQVNYTADVTWNHPQGYVSEVSKTAKLLLNIAAFVVIVGGTAIFLGIFFGGGRALYRRLRGKPASTMSETEFISLHLGE